MNEIPPKDDMPPLPESLPIPQKLVEHWLSMPASQQVALSVTRGEMDQLFNSINKLIIAQSHFRQAMIHWTSGELEKANKENHVAAHLEIESQNALRSFFAAIMAGAKPLEPT